MAVGPQGRLRAPSLNPLTPLPSPCPPPLLFKAWQSGLKGGGMLVMMAYGVEFEPLEKVGDCVEV